MGRAWGELGDGDLVNLGEGVGELVDLGELIGNLMDLVVGRGKRVGKLGDPVDRAW